MARAAVLTVTMFAIVALAAHGATVLKTGPSGVTVPVLLDHNRMLVDAELQRKDGSWRTARLWVDSGNPDFFMTAALARDLGYDVPPPAHDPAAAASPVAVAAPASVRIGRMALDFSGVASKIMHGPHWLFGTTHSDGNLPSTVLRKYHVVFDYPSRRLTLAQPGTVRPRGVRSAALVNPKNGIVQLAASLDGERFSLALDNGASYSFVSRALFERIASRHPEWPHSAGATGCANIWGWWPEEESWPLMRVPLVEWGSVPLADLVLVGLPDFFSGGRSVGAWYSQKTAEPVEGFLGPNALQAFRVEIDYRGGAVYFERRVTPANRDMDLVGLTLRPEADGRYRVIGIARVNGRPVVEGVEPGDLLVQVNGREVSGRTMGCVIDALRGKPGERRVLVLDRQGARVTVRTHVRRLV